MGHKKLFSYVQSRGDVPCRISAETSPEPVFSLSKWDRETGILFRTEFPEERVRRGEQYPGRTVITTNKRRHVYRRLDKERFEYDIILPDYPGTSCFRIPLEDTGGLSFYKQGKRLGHLMRPELRGSYAVYWKRRNNRYKTGKLCHIYRPRIIDAAGRWIWGELDWDGRALLIRVDKEWLKRARYPVTIDPVIGTQSAGAGSYDFVDSEPGMPYFESYIVINCFSLEEAMTGAVTAHYHSYKNDGDAGGYGLIYDDTGGKVPRNLVSTGASHFHLGSGWSGTGFSVPDRIPEGSYIWLGLCAEWLYYPSFDEIEGNMLKVHCLDNPTSGPLESFIIDQTFQDILLSLYCSWEPSTVFSHKIIGRIKPDEELFRRGEFYRRREETLQEQESFAYLRGILRLIQAACNVTSSILRFCSYAPLISMVCRASGVFRKQFCYFRSFAGSYSLWDYFKDFFGRSCEELVLYSGITGELNMDSQI